MEIALLVVGFAMGFVATLVKLPPLVGYLLAGFVLHAFGFETSGALETVSDLGVLLLLFGIGLKLRLRTLGRPQVWATATAFAMIGTIVVVVALLGLGALDIPLARELDLTSAGIVGFALSFSSTVFAVKALERTDEAASLAGRIAVGVLVLQDIFAVAFLVAVGGTRPSWWALALIPLFAIIRPVFGWILEHSGHGEILVLLGFTLAVGIGAEAFAIVDLKPDLGALLAGFVLSGHPRAPEMADRLLAFKDLFLVGFFLSIGLAGTPPINGWIIGVVAVVLVPSRSFVLIWLLTRFRLRSRTALHAALTLSTYSEFGLIVAAAALSAGLLDQAWVSTLAVAVAVSFVMASAANSARYRLYDRWFPTLARLEREPIIPDDSIIDCGPARVLIFGMGRIGTGAYDELVKRRGGLVVGVDRWQQTVDDHRTQGRAVIRGDALDRDFWERVRFHPDVELVIAAMSSHAANLECVNRIREFLPDARIAAIATYPDQVAELRAAGVDVARNLYEEAGQALADDAVAVVWEPD